MTLNKDDDDDGSKMQRRRRPRKAGPPPPPPPGPAFYNHYFHPNAIKDDEHVQGLLQACFPAARNRRSGPMPAPGAARASGSCIAEDPLFTSFLHSLLSAPQDDVRPAPRPTTRLNNLSGEEREKALCTLASNAQFIQQIVLSTMNEDISSISKLETDGGP
ncbi:hypothetical protein GOP47_0024521 [Adiantum capillus-veneris]|uniref:Uncharacterized protein n=1 Tax=Adiantum capillus-veneris TaxID=13818 RepID=A0A9D4Z545_ADICA|nr:hypothetical protein GOP47_0024521 [Adiantum capillus-veneris]